VHRTYALRLALAATALAAVAGCGQPTAPADDATVNVPSQPTLTLDTETPDAVDTTAPVEGGSFDLSEQLTTTSCAPAGGVWSYSGTLKNPGSDDLHATVAVSLVKKSDSSVITTKEIDVVVKAGQSVPVGAKNFYTEPAGDAGIECLTGASDKDE
jgi:hypothetical protein